MTLLHHLRARIAHQGPLSISDYMQDCLLHPQFGYYTTAQAFGAAGDFITAPEISQMFGELIGLSLAQTWLDQGAPERFTFLELGPGRGTLMSDILRATKAVPGFHKAAKIILFEASERLRNTQAQTLSDYAPQWVETLETLENIPLFGVANEFFDALPIRQFIRSDAHWRERQVGLEKGQLAFGLGPALPQPALAQRQEDTQQGDLIETCSAAVPFMDLISTRIQSCGGAALIIDYGDWRSLGDTLQALQNHEPVDPLTTPGAADLTAHVDFEALAQSANCAFSRITPQGVFLERLGITARAQALAKNLTAAALDAHIAAHRRLTHPQEMGTLFKVMGLYPKGALPPVGLEK